MIPEQIHKPRIFVWTPACVFNEGHLSANLIQMLVKKRLEKFLTKASLVSGLIVDWAADECRAGLDEIAGHFDVSRYGVPQQFGTTWGIRKGTCYSIALARETQCDYILRIIQDVCIDDPAELASRIESAMEETGDWIAACVQHWPENHNNGYGQFTAEMGLPFTPEIDWPHGELLFAPISVWETYYAMLPARIHHHWDDIMMGLALLHRGGRFINWTPVWRHRHNGSQQESDAIYREQLLQMKGW